MHMWNLWNKMGKPGRGEKEAIKKTFSYKEQDEGSLKGGWWGDGLNR